MADPERGDTQQPIAADRSEPDAQRGLSPQERVRRAVARAERIAADNAARAAAERQRARDEAWAASVVATRLHGARQLFMRVIEPGLVHLVARGLDASGRELAFVVRAGTLELALLQLLRAIGQAHTGEVAP